ncbi:MAG: calcium/sodium antiporter [Candidatus Diapherotrites archaeon]
MVEIMLLGTGLLAFIAGLFVLVFGSDKLVESAVNIAKMLSISTFIIGLTLVGIGTSLPELAFAIIATMNDSAGFVLGDVIGSNIANIGLVLALAVLYGGTIKIKRRILNIDGIILLGITVLFLLLMIDGAISFSDALILLLVYLFYLLFLFESLSSLMKVLDISKMMGALFHVGGSIWNLHTLFQMKEKGLTVKTYENIVDAKLDGKDAKEMIENKRKGKDFITIFREILFAEIFKNFGVLIASIFIIFIGALLMVEGSVRLATFFGVSDDLIGLTIVAIGTSLPEMAVSFAAIKKKTGNILIGNILGSNISNILLIIGLSAVINPIIVPSSVIIPAIMMLVITALLLQAIVKEYDITKKEALFLLVFYIVFVVSLPFITSVG